MRSVYNNKFFCLDNQHLTNTYFNQMTTKLQISVLHCHWSTDDTHSMNGPNNPIASILFREVCLSLSGTVKTKCLIYSDISAPCLAQVIALEQAVFLLAVESHMTPGMTSCNINKDFRAQKQMSHHLPRLPNGAAQEHAEDHPKHL